MSALCFSRHWRRCVDVVEWRVAACLLQTRSGGCRAVHLVADVVQDGVPRQRLVPRRQCVFGRRIESGAAGVRPGHPRQARVGRRGTAAVHVSASDWHESACRNVKKKQSRRKTPTLTQWIMYMYQRLGHCRRFTRVPTTDTNGGVAVGVFDSVPSLALRRACTSDVAAANCPSSFAASCTPTTRR